jgi:type II secretory pathway pseudopilin PulG
MSLIESVVAGVVISTTMAVSLPSLHRARQAYMLRSAAYDVAARMHFARIAAISGNRTCRLSVTSATSYVIECEDGVWKPVARLRTSGGITVEANARPEFHYRGNVTPTATFTLRNRIGGIRRVIVNINGRVRIQ